MNTSKNSAKATMWILTANNPHTHLPNSSCEELLQAWHEKGGAAFVTGQLEKGESGTPHLQAFLHFKTQVRRSYLNQFQKHTSYFVVKKNNGADEYCNKAEGHLEGPWSFGIKPARLNEKGDKKRRNEQLIEMGAEEAVKNGIIDIKDYPKVKSAIDLFKNCTQRPEAMANQLENNEWWYGPPGSGKTRHVVTHFPDYYEKDKSKYWNGYTDQ